MKSSDSHLQDGVSPNLFLSKTFGKSHPLSLKEASRSLGNPLVGWEGSMGQSLILSLGLGFLLSLCSQVRGSGQKAAAGDEEMDFSGNAKSWCRG